VSDRVKNYEWSFNVSDSCGAGPSPGSLRPTYSAVGRNVGYIKVTSGKTRTFVPALLGPRRLSSGAATAARCASSTYYRQSFARNDIQSALLLRSELFISNYSGSIDSLYVPQRAYTKGSRSGSWSSWSSPGVYGWVAGTGLAKGRVTRYLVAWCWGSCRVVRLRESITERHVLTRLV
jgi:hypothetical protein